MPIIPPALRTLPRQRVAQCTDGRALEATSIPPISEAEAAIQLYLEGFTGRPHPKGSSDYANASSYIAYVKQQCRWTPSSPFAAVKDSSPLPPNSLATETQIFTALNELAAGMKANSHWSVYDGINSLAAAGIFRTDLNEEDIAVAVQLLFVMSGSITMLFTPIPPGGEIRDELQVDVSGTRGFLTSSQPVTRAERPLVEILKGFGEILPVRRRKSSEFDDRETETDLLEVATLNIATLIGIGDIRIVWVKSASSHLEFDRFRRQLSLFCLPSFCLLNITNMTPSESILNDYYDDSDLPASRVSGSGHPLFREILLSYSLLIGDDRQARSMYRRKERERARATSEIPTDPCLDNLCGMDLVGRSYLASFRSPVTLSYSKTRDFPLLAERLSDLQSYILAQQPNRLTALWHDRRSLLSWYTFWAVLLFGFVGIVCSILQTFLAVVQTAIAWKTYQAQLAYPPNP